MGIKVFKALSNEIRFEIVKKLIERNMCISDFQKFFNRDFSVLYRHIKELEDANIVYLKKEGRKYIVCLKNADLVKRLLKIAEEIEKFK